MNLYSSIRFHTSRGKPVKCQLIYHFSLFFFLECFTKQIAIVVVSNLRSTGSPRLSQQQGETGYPNPDMVKASSLLLVWLLSSLIFLQVCSATESPQYTVVHTESDFEIRLYRDSVWMCAVVDDISFDKATKTGFHRLFQYIQGANMNYSRIPMTKPVLTSILPGAGPLGSSAYYVCFFLPVKFQGTPPLALSELNLKPATWPSHCIAVRKFSGFATDTRIVTEAKRLSTSLDMSPWANSTTLDSKYAYSIAQYDSPFRFIGRVNEVWVDIDGSELDGCGATLRVATY
ncbi:hypothetical protein Dimus_023801 [Dionaea muscipula]